MIIRPPVIKIISPVAGTYSSGANILFSYVVVDLESGIASDSATLDYKVAITNGQSIHANTLPKGTHIFTVKATNNAGLSSKADVLFSIDKPSVVAKVTTVAFNYTPTIGSNDAIDIIQEAPNGIIKDVALPEWVAGRAVQSPACYSLNSTAGLPIFIQAEFQITTPANFTGTVKIKGKGGGILGDVEENVDFQNGKTISPVPFILLNEKMHSDGYIDKENVEWDWVVEWSESYIAKPIEVDMGKTDNTIYVVLDNPQSPWYSGGDSTKPWVTALDVACVAAQRSNTAESAAAAVTQYIYTQRGLLYDVDSGAPAFSETVTRGNPLSGWIFDLEAFLATPGATVNCYDCACAVYTFTNLLGTSLEFIYHSPYGYLNYVYPIGRDVCNNPFYDSVPANAKRPIDETFPPGPRQPFGNHAYCEMGNTVFDATMAYDVDQNPNTVDKRLFVDIPEATYFDEAIDKDTPPESSFAGTPTNNKNIVNVKLKIR